MSEIAVVVMAYNRPESLARLLKSLSMARIPPGTPLIISIDQGPEQSAIVNIARQFNWVYGLKRVLDRPEHLGLVNHYLACGELTRSYQAIVLLEDDLVVAPPFFQFVEQAFERLHQDSRISGITLNALWFNGYTHYRFTPLLDDSDCFFLSIPWYHGQVLWVEAWQPFRDWLAAGNGQIQPDDPLHPSFQQFAPDEWFPAYAKYLVSTKRYFAFPRQSVAVNYGDIGTHFNKRSNHFQTPLQRERAQFRIQSIDNSLALYDSFFELNVERLPEWIREYEPVVDFQGTKPEWLLSGRWVLTSQPCHRFEHSFGLQRRPIEANIIENVPGEQLFLTRAEDIRRDRMANWHRQYKLDKYYRRQRPISWWLRLLGRFLE